MAISNETNKGKLLRYHFSAGKETSKQARKRRCKNSEAMLDQGTPSFTEFCRTLTRPFDASMVNLLYSYLHCKVYDEEWEKYEQYDLTRSAMTALGITEKQREGCWALVEIMMQYFANKGAMKLESTTHYSQLDKLLWRVLAEMQPGVLDKAAVIADIVSGCTADFTENRDQFYVDEFAAELQQACRKCDISLTCHEAMADAVFDFMHEKGDWA
ncbi:MAG TPA: hypothetical protein PKM44_16060 [Turneriella sp.]|nr:hypothetical protein [Turneriella sp.]